MSQSQILGVCVVNRLPPEASSMCRISSSSSQSKSFIIYWENETKNSIKCEFVGDFFSYTKVFLFKVNHSFYSCGDFLFYFITDLFLSISELNGWFSRRVTQLPEQYKSIVIDTKSIFLAANKINCLSLSQGVLQRLSSDALRILPCPVHCF